MNEFSWEYSLTDEYFLQENHYTKNNLKDSGYEDLTEHKRITIVQKVNLSDLKLFYKKLNSLLGVDINIPAPHITLFSWSDYEPQMTRGIGIGSEEEFNKYTKERLFIKKESLL